MRPAAEVEHVLSLAHEHPTMRQMTALHMVLSELPPIALRVAAFGRGGHAGSRAWVRRACDFSYEGASRLGEVRFGAPMLRTAAPKIFTGQRELFSDSIDPGMSAFSLLGLGLRDIVNENADSERFDEYLLRRFAAIGGRLLRGEGDCVTLQGLQAGLDTFGISSQGPERARRLLAQTPAAQRVRVAGKLTMLRIRGEAFEVATDDGGSIRCRWSGGNFSALARHFGAAVVMTGVAHYRPSGQVQRVDVDVVEAARASDAIFSKIPRGARGALEVAVRKSHRGGREWFNRLIGQWPGDETEAELLDKLREMS